MSGIGSIIGKGDTKAFEELDHSISLPYFVSRLAHRWIIRNRSLPDHMRDISQQGGRKLVGLRVAVSPLTVILGVLDAALTPILLPIVIIVRLVKGAATDRDKRGHHFKVAKCGLMTLFGYGCIIGLTAACASPTGLAIFLGAQCVFRIPLNYAKKKCVERKWYVGSVPKLFAFASFVIFAGGVAASAVFANPMHLKNTLIASAVLITIGKIAGSAYTMHYLIQGKHVPSVTGAAYSMVRTALNSATTAAPAGAPGGGGRPAPAAAAA